MIANELVTVEAWSGAVLTESKRVRVFTVRGDFVWLDLPRAAPLGNRSPMMPVAFHRRTGKPRRANGWRLAKKHCDERAGRGTTK